jgi:hypothetical protein
MKCRKCGYTSFDHNETCPSCHRDLSSERAQLGVALPFHSPDPPEEFSPSPGPFETTHYPNPPAPRRVTVEDLNRPRADHETLSGTSSKESLLLHLKEQIEPLISPSSALEEEITPPTLDRFSQDMEVGPYKEATPNDSFEKSFPDLEELASMVKEINRKPDP